MSSFTKTIAILDLFDGEKTNYTIEEIIDVTNLTAPTAYRYVRDLCEVGLLARFTGGEYTIGPRAIQLDYIIRQSDVIITKGIPVMQEIVQLLGSDVLYGSLYNNAIILSHEEQPFEQLPNRSIARGKKLHPFVGSTAKAIVSHLPKARVKQIYTHYENDPKVQQLGHDFEAVWRTLLRLRKQGFVKSIGEIDDDKISISMPIFYENQVRSAVTFGIQKERYELFEEAKLIELLQRTATKLTDFLEA